jgi:parallel beta-helix repeat protein
MPTTLRSHATPARLTSVLLVLVLATAGAMIGERQARASHVSCGDTITADTTLDSDLLNCPNNGIVIGADDITLNLNGHAMTGNGELVEPCPPDEFCDVGIANDGHNGVTVRNGSVRRFAVGAFIFGARRNRVLDISASRNVFSGILLVESVRSAVRRNVASRNAGPDSGVGITLFESHNNRIAHNRVRRNHELALHLLRSDENLIRHNRTRRHQEGGILVEGDRNRIARNRTRDGILISIFTDGGRAVGNVVARNRVRDARRAGIAVDRVPRGTVLRSNKVFRSGGHGILVGNPRTTLARNTANRNGDLGIKAVAGVTDGGGNIAHNNGDPRQCVNVTCN